jgi:hypothetical protein
MTEKFFALFLLLFFSIYEVLDDEEEKHFSPIRGGCEYVAAAASSSE